MRATTGSNFLPLNCDCCVIYDGFELFVLCLCVFFSLLRARHPIKYNIHSLHYCYLHSTRCFVCRCVLFFLRQLMFQTKPTGFADRLLQYADKRFNWRLSCSMYVCVLAFESTIQLWHLNSHFISPNFTCLLTLNHSKIKHTHTLAKLQHRIIFLLLAFCWLSSKIVLMPLNFSLMAFQINTAQFLLE